MPDVPESFTADMVNSTSIVAFWQTPTNPNGIITHYQLFYIESSMGECSNETETFVIVESVKGRNMYNQTLVNLSEFTTYQLCVRAFTRIGPGDFAGPAFVRTDPDSASPPFNVQAMVLGSKSIKISWGYPEMPRGNISQYEIEHNVTGVNNSLNVSNTLSGPGMERQSHEFNDLTPFTYYQFRVRAISYAEIRHLGMFSVPMTVLTSEDGK